MKKLDYLNNQDKINEINNMRLTRIEKFIDSTSERVLAGGSDNSARDIGFNDGRALADWNTTGNDLRNKVDQAALEQNRDYLNKKIKIMEDFLKGEIKTGEGSNLDIIWIFAEAWHEIISTDCDFNGKFIQRMHEVRENICKTFGIPNGCLAVNAHDLQEKMKKESQESKEPSL